jgi:hypothetical protein
MLNVFNFRQLNSHKTQYIFPPNPAITPLPSLQVLGLLQYLLGLPPDILKPLVMQAAIRALRNPLSLLLGYTPLYSFLFKSLSFYFLYLRKSLLIKGFL